MLRKHYHAKRITPPTSDSIRYHCPECEQEQWHKQYTSGAFEILICCVCGNRLSFAIKAQEAQ